MGHTAWRDRWLPPPHVPAQDGNSSTRGRRRGRKTSKSSCLPAHAKTTASGVYGDAVRLANNLAGWPRNKAGKIVSLAENRTSRSTHHHPTHLMGNMIKPVLRERENYRIKLICNFFGVHRINPPSRR